jgi:Protein of unknown function (DUF3592)
MRDLKSLLHTRNWLKTKGQITQCQLIEQGPSCWPEIEYTYKVNDKEYYGNYLFLDTSHNNPHSRYARKIAYGVVMAYNLGEEIDVYYCPNTPNLSALDITIPKKLYVIIGLIILLILTHLLLVGIKLYE